jgi:hypothetical protein
MPDIEVHAGSQAATLHTILRHGRHVLVVPAADPAHVLGDAGLQPYRTDLHVITGEAGETRRFRNGGTGPVVLVRPDGHVAARGRPGSMHSVTGYLRDLFRGPAGELLGEHPVEGAQRAVCGTAANQE